MTYRIESKELDQYNIRIFCIGRRLTDTTYPRNIIRIFRLWLKVFQQHYNVFICL